MKFEVILHFENKIPYQVNKGLFSFENPKDFFKEVNKEINKEKKMFEDNILTKIELLK